MLQGLFALEAYFTDFYSCCARLFMRGRIEVHLAAAKEEVWATPPEQETKPASEWILAAGPVNKRFLSSTAAISTSSCNMLRWAGVSYNLGDIDEC